MSGLSNPFSTGSQYPVTGINNSSTMVGMSAAATLKVAIITLWMTSVAPQSASSNSKHRPSRR